MSADPFCLVIVGAPGTGKSSQIRIQLEQLAPARVLIFDPMQEYKGNLVNLAGLNKQLARAGAGAFNLVYRPGTDEVKLLKARFDIFCKLAFAVGNVLVIVDEAADVTSPNRYQIPAGWSTLMRQGRHRSIRTIAATQRPADIDKRLWSFATRIRTGRLNFSSDRAELANVLNVSADEIAGLVERQWIERDMRTGAIRRGSLEWRKGRPVDLEGRILVPNAAPARAETRDKKIGAPKKRKNAASVGRVPVGR